MIYANSRETICYVEVTAKGLKQRNLIQIFVIESCTSCKLNFPAFNPLATISNTQHKRLFFSHMHMYIIRINYYNINFMTYQRKSSIYDTIPPHHTAYFDKRYVFLLEAIKKFRQNPMRIEHPVLSCILHAVLGVPLSEANRRCKPRHVLQRPPENNTCLHTVNSHNALPANGKLVPFRFLSLAHATRVFLPSSPRPLRRRRRSRPAFAPPRHEVDVPRVLSHRCERACPRSTLSRICGDPEQSGCRPSFFNPFTTTTRPRVRLNEGRRCGYCIADVQGNEFLCTSFFYTRASIMICFFHALA